MTDDTPGMDWYLRNVPTALSVTGVEIPKPEHQRMFEAALAADRKAQRDALLNELHESGRLLADPEGGCACTPFWTETDGFRQQEIEYEPDCPEHSRHVYDPRQGRWVLP